MKKEEIKQKLLETNYFENNEWLGKYCELIELNENTKKEKCKTNSHHIIPKCYYKLIGEKPNNSKENLVNLLYKDHILAHYYLCLCAKNILIYRLECAFFRMVNKIKNFNINIEDLDLDNFQYLYQDYCYKLSKKFKNRIISQESLLKTKLTKENRSKEEKELSKIKRSNSMKGKNKGPRTKEICDKIKNSRILKPITITEEGRILKRQKLSKSMSEERKKHLKESHLTYKFYCKELNLIFNNLLEIKIYLTKNNITHSNNFHTQINACCRGDINKSYGYDWYKIPKDISIEDIGSSYILCKFSSKEKRRNNYKVHCIDLNLTFNTPKEAATYFKSKHSVNILNCCKGKQLKAYGYRWKFIV